MSRFAHAAATARRLLREHVTLVVAVLATLHVALRVMGVSGWNEATAYAILRESGTANVVLGTVLSLVVLVADTSMFVIAIAVISAPPGTSRWGVWWIGAALLPMFVFMPLPTRTVMFSVGFWALAPVIRLVFKNEGGAPRSLRWILTAPVVVAAALAAFVGVIGDQMWLPLETIRLPDGQARYGWVLNADDEEVVLLGGDRRVYYLKGPITRRAICRTRNTSAERSFAARRGWVGGEAYPVCSFSLV